MIRNCIPLASAKMSTAILPKCSERIGKRAALQTRSYLDYDNNFFFMNHGTSKSRQIPRATRNQNHTPFLIEGYQPTTTELANCDDFGFPRGIKESNGGRVLPILDATVILAPGQYCKQTSSKSGIHAAQRLVDGRRAFEEVLTRELSVNKDDKCVAGGYDKTLVEKSERVRKIYALVGHGVPNSLLEHFISCARKWLQCPPSSSTADDAHTTKRESLSAPTSSLQPICSAIQLSLCNISNSTLLDPSKILKTSVNGTTTSIKWPMGWEHDLELFMVVMNRIGSRLSSASIIPDGDEDYDNDDIESHVSAALGTGSVIIPSSLQQWTVTIRKGEALPFHLLPSPHGAALVGCRNGDNAPVLTVEFLRSAIDCWKIVLRLQHEGIKSQNVSTELRRDPMSLVFEGVYNFP